VSQTADQVTQTAGEHCTGLVPCLAEVRASPCLGGVFPLRLFDLVKHDLEVVMLRHGDLPVADRPWNFVRSCLFVSTRWECVQIYG